jgi:UDP-galactopyranose mutase
MPFALNETTRFICPTKTPECLAAGRPVVSTPLVDVVRQYGDLEAVRLASTPVEFVAACEAALALARARGGWLREVDAALAGSSWDETFARMNHELARAPGMRRQALAEVQGSTGAPTPAVRPASRRKPFDYLIVGAGLAGAVLAERLASQLGKRVMLIDRRLHVAGDAYDEKDASGVLMQRYGPHVFHTNSNAVAGYLSQFTRWRPYEHRVLASLSNGVLVPSPINRTTLNAVHGLDLSSDEAAAAFLAGRAEPAGKLRTLKDALIASVGRELYETFFKGYIRKQYGLAASQLDASLMAQPPARTGADDRSYTDTFQNMPADGYTRMFQNMLDQPGVDLQLGLDFDEVRSEAIYDRLIFTGPIDDYFEHRYGKLPYRSLSFRHETLDQEWWQPVAVVNYPAQSTPYTRITEHKHMTGQAIGKTTITYEYPSAEGEPHYPVPRPENLALYKRYEALARRTPNVQFVGRLATYRHCEMDQVVGQALATFRRIAEREGRAAMDAAHGASRALAAS